MDPFEINTDLSAYSAQEIDDLIVAGNAALDVVLALESATPADAAEGERIYGLLTQLEEQKESLAASATDASDRIAALRAARVTASDEGQQDEGEDEDEDEDVEEVEDEVEVEATVQPVVAAATRPRRTAREALGGKRPNKTPARKGGITITAAADISGVPTGSTIDDLDGIVDVLTKRLKSFPSQPMGQKNGSMQHYGVAFLTREHEFKTDNTANDYNTIMEAAKESRLSGGNLIAAGGWCAPSEVIYDLCEGETTDGLIDLPEVGVSRGGIRFTQGPSFATLYAAGFTQTEAQAIAGTTKPCYEITCPSFTEVRLDAMGICIKVPLLTNAGYPELTKRTVSGSLTAHLHRVSAGLITKMVTASTAVTTADVSSTVGNVLNSVGLIIGTIRDEYRMGLNETLEVVLPHWVKDAMRADLVMRNGVDFLAVADSVIQNAFTVRNARVQWVYNWQSLVNGEEGYPATAQMLVYPAGTFVRGSDDVINLDAVYDAASLSVNLMTGLFFEEGVLLAQTCFKSKVVTFNVKGAGTTGAASNTGTFTLTP
jgi:hypothetical protein